MQFLNIEGETYTDDADTFPRPLNYDPNIFASSKLFQPHLLCSQFWNLVHNKAVIFYLKYSEKCLKPWKTGLLDTC